MKIAMFGGSFDPVHLDHVGLCETMIKTASLDKVVVFPAACSPFKKGTQTDGLHRLNMCKLAFEGNNRVEVSDFEITRGGKSYTIDTLEFLKENYPEDEIFLITGADAFVTLDRWYKAEGIFRLAHILTVVRNEDNIQVLREKAEEFKKFGAVCTLVSTPIGSVSSTDVRKALSENADVKELLPEKVINYIKENGLYNYGN